MPQSCGLSAESQNWEVSGDSPYYETALQALQFLDDEAINSFSREQ
jgi:hypothetical protein